ncbi:MAG TPA: hypothetical protein VE870_14330 [Bacteroidales bacterium]|nr:hypothetical protein [Bacteroidales bacterium]
MHLNDECIVLGNSPSLSETLSSIPNFLRNKDIFVVNLFWKHPGFTKIKPRYYVIASTNYWAKNQIPTNREDRLITFRELSRVVNWDMFLFVPAEAKKSKGWKKDLASNTFIRVVYFNLTPVEGFRSFCHWMYKTGMGMPRPHNVLIPTIKFAIDLDYKKIYLLGAEHSWLKELVVADDNTVYLSQKHFYDHNTARPDVMYKGSSPKVRNLSETLMKFVHSFNSYYILNDYAKASDVSIFNATEGSYIDAFERFKPSNN